MRQILEKKKLINVVKYRECSHRTIPAKPSHELNDNVDRCLQYKLGKTPTNQTNGSLKTEAKYIHKKDQFYSLKMQIKAVVKCHHSRENKA